MIINNLALAVNNFLINLQGLPFYVIFVGLFIFNIIIFILTELLVSMKQKEVKEMIELAQTLLPNLPENLNWVYGIIYIVECICFFGMLLSPLFMIFSTPKRRRKRSIIQLLFGYQIIMIFIIQYVKGKVIF